VKSLPRIGFLQYFKSTIDDTGPDGT